MGFQMGEDDRPFSERMWGLGGRQLSPTPGGRRGCMLMLVAAFVGIVVVLIALVVGAR